MGQFQLGNKKKTLPLEILGLERCFQFLVPGGKLAIVLPDGLLANFNTRYVRDWLVQHAQLKAIISLPPETFVPYGANVKTSLCFFRKWKKDERKTYDYEIYMARIDNIGYDAANRITPSHEVEDIIDDFQAKTSW